MKQDMLPKADYLFEVSWEACHQVGGIYTVIKSKAPRIYELYKENYFLIGPYFQEEAAIKFENEKSPSAFKSIFSKLKKEGITCHFGKWAIDGMKINTVLIDFSKSMKKANTVKSDLWKDFKIDSFNSDAHFAEWVVWGTIVGRLLEGLRKTLRGRIVAQFHEYISGAGLLYLRKNKIKIATVFTTHATYLGRVLTGSGINLYQVIKKINPEKEAYKYNIQARYMLEKSSAANAHVFTTVSEITALEAKYLLGKEPDIILPNGLDLSKFPSLEDRAIKHHKFKRQIFKFAKAFFFPYYRFDIEHSLIYFIAGRYEFKNKGIDIYIQALGKLNKRLMEEKSNRTIIALLCIPSEVDGVNPSLLKNKLDFEGISDFVDSSLEELKSNIIDYIVRQKMPTTNEVFGNAFRYHVKKKMIEFKKKGTPLISSHNIINKDDIILKSLKKAGLNNSSHDKVKVIYYPVYLTGADGLIDLSYYNTISGSHLGVFPSYYEPWGYTPLEAAALGVPSLTTDLAGFGKYISRKIKNPKGIFILKRKNIPEKKVVIDLTNIMHDFSKLDRQDRIKLKLEAKQIANLADWKNMVKHYIKAHNLSLGRLK